MYKNQQELLKSKRLEKNLSLSELGTNYTEYETGKSYFGDAPMEISYPIITTLELSMDDLGTMFD